MCINIQTKSITRPGSIRSSPREVLLTDRLRNSVGLLPNVLVYMGDLHLVFFCTEFVYPGCWHFDNGATRKFDDVLLDHGGLPQVISLAVQLLFLVDK